MVCLLAQLFTRCRLLNPFPTYICFLKPLQQTTFYDQFLLLPQCFHLFPIIQLSLLEAFNNFASMLSKLSAVMCCFGEKVYCLLQQIPFEKVCVKRGKFKKKFSNPTMFSFFKHNVFNFRCCNFLLRSCLADYSISII